MRRLLAGVAVAAILIPASVSAQDMDGNLLYEDCAAPKASFTEGICIGYIVGIVGAMGTWASSDRHTCLPPHMNVEQMLDVVTRFLTSHPDKRHRAAGGLVAEAFADAFPCH
jgi:Rap1a immunity proteins